MRWLPLFILVLFVYLEVALFVKIAEVIGVFLALVLVIFTSVLGASLVRRQGMVNFFIMRQKLQAGEDPASEIVRNFILLLAGVLLVLPGFLTDLLGLMLLLPPVQRLIEYRFMPYATIRLRSGDPRSGGQAGQTHTEQDSKRTSGRIIEGEYRRKDDE